ncbi:flagellar assembly protein FliW [bacterium D16-51]|nr:flagellar assembly protein FliW [bacterium D16-59]RKI62769.1 flagellar assembly protein FliW [bacterium D16-51]
MKIDTRYFGEIEIGDEKILHFEQGLFGFEEYKDYTVLYDIEEEEEPFFSWLQCVTEKALAFPIVNPFKVKEDYNPVVEDALLSPIGECSAEDLLVFLLATVPADPKKTTVNMKAPLVINTVNRQGIQIIVENDDYAIRHMIMQEESK